MADRTPNTRLEKWMAKIAGETVDITPKDRLETLLAKIAGESVSITPDDTLEYWLNQIAENGGGGGGTSGGIATVTVNVSEETTTSGVHLYTINPVEIPGLEKDYVYMSEDTVNAESGTATYKVPYDGDGVLFEGSDAIVSCSGNAEVKTIEGIGESLVIYGDCVLNLKLQAIN